MSSGKTFISRSDEKFFYARGNWRAGKKAPGPFFFSPGKRKTRGKIPESFSRFLFPGLLLSGTESSAL